MLYLWNICGVLLRVQFRVKYFFQTILDLNMTSNRISAMTVSKLILPIIQNKDDKLHLKE